jgi:glucose-6-phosphate dehydrogenase assembly protein OpcA
MASSSSAGGLIEAPRPEAGQPVLRWSSRAHTVEGVEMELARIWGSISKTTMSPEGDEERHVAARSSVMNLVVIAGRGETGERAAAIVQGLTGRHPSRTLIVSTADPDGPSWLDAQIQAHCIMPSETAPETCAELIYLTVGGQAGQHLAGIVAPLLIHDLPVLVWWPAEPRFDSPQSKGLLDMADRILVDASIWTGDGLARLQAMAGFSGTEHVAISDFALLRQERWREAIASTFDRPDLRPYLRGIREVTVFYAARDTAPGATNVVKPLYHAAWIASRMGWLVDRPMEARPEEEGGYDALLRDGRRHIAVGLRPTPSPLRAGTTVGVDLLAARRGSELLAIDVTAHAEGVTVRASLDGAALPERHFLSPRRTEAELLAETIESVGRDKISAGALAMASRLIGSEPAAAGR